MEGGHRCCHADPGRRERLVDDVHHFLHLLVVGLCSRLLHLCLLAGLVALYQFLLLLIEGLCQSLHNGVLVIVVVGLVFALILLVELVVVCLLIERQIAGSLVAPVTSLDKLTLFAVNLGSDDDQLSLLLLCRLFDGGQFGFLALQLSQLILFLVDDLLLLVQDGLHALELCLTLCW